MTHPATPRTSSQPALRAPSRTRQRRSLMWTTGALLIAAATSAGTLDVAIAGGPSAVDIRCLADGAGTFSCAPVASPGSWDVAIAEVDGDDHLDLVLARNSGDDLVCLGDGTGTFDDCSAISGSGAASLGVAVGFLTSGDQDVDLVFANSFTPDTACRGNGSGSFTCTEVSNDTDNSRDAAIGLLGGSNWPDVMFAVFNGRNRVCLGDGMGGFDGCADVDANMDSSLGLAIGDIDGDGDQDAIFANFGQRDRICYRQGAAFSCVDLPLVGDLAAAGVALAQLNGGGRLDAVFADAEGRSRVCLEVGSNTACSDVFDQDRVALSVALGQIDGDGILDAVFGMSGGEVEVCFGDGLGGLGGCTPIAGSGNAGANVALGELETLIFADGFESGDTSAWSATLP